MKISVKNLSKRQRNRLNRNLIRQQNKNFKSDLADKKVARKNTLKQIKLMTKTPEQMKHELAMRKTTNRTLLGTQAIATAGSNISTGVNRQYDYQQAVQGGMTDKGQIGRDEDDNSNGAGPFDKPATDY